MFQMRRGNGMLVWRIRRVWLGFQQVESLHCNVCPEGVSVTDMTLFHVLCQMGTSGELSLCQQAPRGPCRLTDPSRFGRPRGYRTDDVACQKYG